jgi:zinc and cadmium transporter
VAASVLGGLLAFFVLEKLVLWRHCHHETCEVHGVDAHEHDHAHDHAHAHDHGHQRAGLMILVGDTFHNFVDGVLIAGAFVADTQLGIVTALAIIAHELPQEVGDFLVLLNSGFSKARALALNALSSLAAVAGALLGYFALSSAEAWVPRILAISAAGMIYVAVADLIPGLHKRPELRATAQQALLIAAGVAAIALVRALSGAPH